MNLYSPWFYSTSIDPSVDTIQEFKIQTATYSAEYGLGAGTVTLAFKSGTNAFHGSAYDYIRNPEFNARNFFSPAIDQFKRNQFGATVGGPIWKNHTFFFFGYEGVREKDASTGYATVPTADERAGIMPVPITDPLTGQLFPNNTIPQNRLDPVAMAAIAKFYPKLPNVAGTNELIYDAASPLTNNKYGLRVDQTLGTKDNFFFRYMWYSQASQPVFGPGLMDYKNGYDAGNQAGAWTHTFSPTLVNDFHGSHRREGLNQINVLDATGQPFDFVQAAGIIGMPDPTSSGAPYFGVPGLGSVGSYFVPAIVPMDTYELSDTLVKVKGKHTIKMGFDYMRDYQTTTELYISGRGVYSYTGQYTGLGLGDFLLGTPQGVTASGPPPPNHLAYTDAAIFVADDWKVTRNLTLNIGWRWTVQTPPVERNDYLTDFDYASGKIVVAGKNGTYPAAANPQILAANPDLFTTAKAAGYPLRALRKTNWDDNDPRFGFAWQVRPGWALHGGFGISHTPVPMFYQWSQTYSIPFLGTSYGVTNTQPIPSVEPINPFKGVPAGTVIAAGPYIASGKFYPPVDPHQYVEQISFGAEKQLGLNTKAELNYVGSLGRHLEIAYRGVNYPDPGPGAIQPRRPFTNVGAFSTLQDSSLSNYHSLQANVTRRVAAGLSMTSAFTWSKTLDYDPGSYYAGWDQFHKSYGQADNDIPFHWSSSYVYELPFGKGKHFLNQGGVLNQIVGGWMTTGIISLQSGTPYTVYVAGDPANVGEGTDLPNRVCSGKISNPSLQQWFNPNCFEVEGDTNLPLSQRSVFGYGNSGRNILRSPSFRDFDAGVYRNFVFKENIRLQLRLEAFNAFNHPSFGTPYNALIPTKVVGQSTSQVNPDMGVISSATDPRLAQVSVRLDF